MIWKAPTGKPCERCKRPSGGKRFRCQNCNRLCCRECLDWGPRNDYGRKGWLVCAYYQLDRDREDCSRIAKEKTK